MKMKRVADLYFRLLSIQIRSQMQFRTAFFIDVVTTAMINGSYFVSTFLVLQRFNTIAGWNLGEIAFLYGMIEMAFGTMDMVFSGFDPDYFSIMVRQGALDQVMLRPLSISVQILGSKFMLRRLGRVTQGALVFALALSLTQIHWTADKLFYLPVVFVSQVVAMGSLFMVGATLTIWTVQPIEAMNILTYGGVELMSYPTTIYPNWIIGIFTYVFPFIFLNYYPALYFMDKPDPLGMPVFAPFLAPVAAGAMLLAAAWFWRFGLRHYQSTGT
jgi:ABC-2 type transport system permease protein